jgi:hypothetical protein
VQIDAKTYTSKLFHIARLGRTTQFVLQSLENQKGYKGFITYVNAQAIIGHMHKTAVHQVFVSWFMSIIQAGDFTTI